MTSEGSGWGEKTRRAANAPDRGLEAVGKKVAPVAERFVRWGDKKVSWLPMAVLAGYVGWQANDMFKSGTVDPRGPDSGETQTGEDYALLAYDEKNKENLDAFLGALRAEHVSRADIAAALDTYLTKTIATLSEGGQILSPEIVLGDLTIAMSFVSGEPGVRPEAIGHLMMEMSTRSARLEKIGEWETQQYDPGEPVK